MSTIFAMATTAAPLEAHPVHVADAQTPKGHPVAWVIAGGHRKSKGIGLMCLGSTYYAHAASCPQPPLWDKRTCHIQRPISAAVCCLGIEGMLEGSLSSQGRRTGGQAAVAGMLSDLPDGHTEAQYSAVIAAGEARYPGHDAGYMTMMTTTARVVLKKPLQNVSTGSLLIMLARVFCVLACNTCLAECVRSKHVLHWACLR